MWCALARLPAARSTDLPLRLGICAAITINGARVSESRFARDRDDSEALPLPRRVSARAVPHLPDRGRSVRGQMFHVERSEGTADFQRIQFAASRAPALMFHMQTVV